MSVDEVVTRVEELAVVPPQNNTRTVQSSQKLSLVELTGGEPLLQPEVIPLAQQLVDRDFRVMIETSGERLVSVLPREVIKIVDVKCPDSGEPDTFRIDNLDAVGEQDEIKFVISTRRDFEFARDFTRQHDLARRVHQVIFSPVHADPEGAWPGLDARLVAEWILAEGLPVRLGLQLHKFIWHPATRGV